ncbi:MAG: hypothetical protein IPK26_01025 [Planctomycetes bacterium]|nr:hypothetical protein [Planctomycetota bacterium]
MLVAKGKTHVEHRLKDLTAAELQALVIGPTGKLRAPTLLVGDAVVVGFSAPMYEAVLA